MKKIVALILFVGLSFVLASCGPNSQYYKSNQKVYYYNNTPLVLDPYTLIEDADTSDWIKGISVEEFETFREDYSVKFEYRVQNSGDKYKNYQFAKEDETYQVVVNNPTESFKGEVVKYEVKIHFINKDTKDLKEMINYYGVYTLTPSDIYPLASVINVEQYGQYDLLSNLEVKDMTEDQLLTDLYQFTFKAVDSKGKAVTLDNAEGLHRFMVKGTFTVTIAATEILAEGGGGNTDDTDGDTGASEPWEAKITTPKVTYLSNFVPLATDEEPVVKLGDTFTITFTVIVK